MRFFTAFIQYQFMPELGSLIFVVMVIVTSLPRHEKFLQVLFRLGTVHYLLGVRDRCFGVRDKDFF